VEFLGVRMAGVAALFAGFPAVGTLPWAALGVAVSE
jgi:hypothetical protein